MALTLTINAEPHSVGADDGRPVGPSLAQRVQISFGEVERRSCVADCRHKVHPDTIEACGELPLASGRVLLEA
jgi:hypothetical protein